MKKQMKKWKFAFLISAVILLGCTSAVFADGELKMDGSFYDWEDVSHVSIETQESFYNKISVKMDEKNLYIHCVEQQANLWEPFTYMQFSYKTEDNAENGFVFTVGNKEGDLTQIVVRNRNGYNEINGAVGYRYVVDGKGEWEAMIPLDNIPKITEMSIGLGYGTALVYEPTEEELLLSHKTEENPSGGGAFTPDEEEKKEPANGQEAAAGDIVIDGYYDDWADKMHYLVTNWNMPDDQRTKDNCRQFSALYSDDMIYMHLIMISGWQDNFNGAEYRITANGKTVVFVLSDKNNKYNTMPSVDRTPRTQELGVYYRAGQPAGFPDMTLIENSKAYMTIQEGKPDEAEFCIPVSVFETVFGEPIGDFTELIIENPNIMYGQKITIAGTSSAPWIISGIGAAIAVSGAIAYTRKKNKEELVRES